MAAQISKKRKVRVCQSVTVCHRVHGPADAIRVTPAPSTAAPVRPVGSPGNQGVGMYPVLVSIRAGGRAGGRWLGPEFAIRMTAASSAAADVRGRGAVVSGRIAVDIDEM